MNFRISRIACLGLLAGTAIFELGSPAYSVTLLDNYYGGLDTYNNPGDVIGPPLFDITSADITRINNGNTLQVIIYTAFAGAPGTPAADGTNYGSLFFAPTWNPTGPAPYSNDAYVANEWTSAFVTTSSSAGGLYSTGTGATPNPDGPNPAVVASYTTTTGTVVMSNVGGDPVTAPGANNPGFYFRQGQAVEFDPTAAALRTGSWSVQDGVSITYDINDNGLLGNDFAIAWAMTCANDVIQGMVDIPTGRGGEGAPGPIAGAGLPGLAFAGLGLIAWMRTRRNEQGSAAFATA